MWARIDPFPRPQAHVTDFLRADTAITNKGVRVRNDLAETNHRRAMLLIL